MSTRTGAHADAAQTHLPHKEPDEVSVTNFEVESAMNHRHLKEALRTLALIEPEFTALSTVHPSCQGRTYRSRTPVLKIYTGINLYKLSR